MTKGAPPRLEPEAAVRRLELGASIAEVARGCEVNANVLHRWRRELGEFGARAFTGPGRSRAEENRIAALERKVGQQAAADGKAQAELSRGSATC